MEVPNLKVIEGTVIEVIIRRGKTWGVVVEGSGEIRADAVIIATGTFLRGKIHLGEEISPGGRAGERPSLGITESLEKAGMRSGRFKTGTPPRIRDVGALERSEIGEDWGDDEPIPFSNFHGPSRLPKRPCWLTATTHQTHTIIRRNIEKAPLYNGQIRATGPRSCPSLEDKVMRFPERESHQVYIEPEGLDTAELYLNGLSTSLPREIQDQIVASIPGLKRAEISRYGYAIEYDYFSPDQLNPSLEAKTIKGLYLAGQVNGTTGYEEAAALGLMAGINAALGVQKSQPLLLSRSQAYIGVMIDDLILKGVDYPYRMYTSRAEFRLLLRNDNADIRLSPIGRQLGLLKEEEYNQIIRKEMEIERLLSRLRHTRCPQEQLEEALDNIGESFKNCCTLEEVLRRPGIRIGDLVESGLLGEYRDSSGVSLREAELIVKYEGYIKRCERECERIDRLEARRIPNRVDYDRIQNMMAVSREKLKSIKPRTLGQASRIPGITKNDIFVLAVALEKDKKSRRLGEK
jgi:tRNA uridine 5-carboxymethylaminomethyl modification enzyme